MSERPDAILARHVKMVPFDICAYCSDPWACDAHQLGVALAMSEKAESAMADRLETARVAWVQRAHKWHRMALAAEAREQRLRAALQDMLAYGYIDTDVGSEGTDG